MSNTGTKCLVPQFYKYKCQLRVYVHKFKDVKSVSAISALPLLQCCGMTRKTLPLEEGLVFVLSSYYLFSYICFVIMRFSVINLSPDQHRKMLHGIANRRWLPTSCRDLFWVGNGRVALAKVKGFVGRLAEWL